MNIFAHDDYRAFMKAFYATRKASSEGFSFRAFAKQAGMRSENHAKLVMDGHRNLTHESATRYAAAMGLRRDEAEFFVDLVFYSQATTPGAKDAAYRKLLRHPGYRRVHVLAESQATYHAHWYVPVVRELVGCPGFQEDPAWIADHVTPKITASEADKALATLVTLGLVRRNDDGHLEPADPTITTGAEARGHQMAAFHRAMLSLAAESIDRFPAAQRDVTAVTIRVAPEAMADVKALTAAFRRQLLALEDDGDGARTVVLQVGIQVFPVADAGPNPPPRRGEKS